MVGNRQTSIFNWLFFRAPGTHIANLYLCSPSGRGWSSTQFRRVLCNPLFSDPSSFSRWDEFICPMDIEFEGTNPPKIATPRLGGSSQLVSSLYPPYISHLGHLEGEQPYLGDLLTMVINHLLNGMIPTDCPITPRKFNSSPLKKLWLEDDPFLLGFGNFSGAKTLNFGRVTNIEMDIPRGCLQKERQLQMGGFCCQGFVQLPNLGRLKSNLHPGKLTWQWKMDPD